MSNTNDNNQLFVTAVKDGRYVSIADFKPKDGNKCGCFCPECGLSLRSNISSKDPRELKINFTNHFSHNDEGTACKGGYKETRLHLLAKSIIEAEKSLNVPGSPFHFSDKIEYAYVAVEPAFPSEKYKQYRPDIILTTLNEEKIAIEIFVTNDVSFKKTQLYWETKLKCLKIDLAEFHELDLEEFKTEIEKEILQETARKRWISPAINSTANSSAQNETVGCMLFLIVIIATITFMLLLKLQ